MRLTDAAPMIVTGIALDRDGWHVYGDRRCVSDAPPMMVDLKQRRNRHVHWSSWVRAASYSLRLNGEPRQLRLVIATHRPRSNCPSESGLRNCIRLADEERPRVTSLANEYKWPAGKWLGELNRTSGHSLLNQLDWNRSRLHPGHAAHLAGPVAREIARRHTHHH